jgi:hypothetical protein
MTTHEMTKENALRMAERHLHSYRAAEKTLKLHAEEIDFWLKMAGVECKCFRPAGEILISELGKKCPYHQGKDPENPPGEGWVWCHKCVSWYPPSSAHAINPEIIGIHDSEEEEKPKAILEVP